MIGNKTAIMKALQEYSVNPAGEKTFEQLYGNVALEGQKALSSLETQFAEDVASAYSAAQMSKQNILSSNLLTGAKEEELDYLGSELEKAYETYKQKFLSNMSSAEESISQATGAVTSLLDKEAENYIKLEQSFYPYLQALYKEQTEKGTNLFNTGGWSKFVQDVDGKKQLKSWIDISRDFYTVDETGTYLNEQGANFYDQMINAMETSKSGLEYFDWLQTYDKTGELYNWATSTNPYAHIKDDMDLNRRIAMFKNLYGLDSSDASWSKTAEGAPDVLTHFSDNITRASALEDESAMLSDFSTLFDEYESIKSGLTEEQQKQIEKDLYSGTEFKYDLYKVQGLGSGRKNDDIDITIGADSRMKDVEYDLLVGDAVGENSVPTLNKLATGNADTPPENGKLMVVRNKMYIYTKQGWKYVVDDNKEGTIDKAIKTFLSKPNLVINTNSYGFKEAMENWKNK